MRPQGPRTPTRSPLPSGSPPSACGGRCRKEPPDWEAGREDLPGQARAPLLGVLSVPSPQSWFRNWDRPCAVAEGPHGGDRSLRSRHTEDVREPRAQTPRSWLRTRTRSRGQGRARPLRERRDAGARKGHGLAECPGRWLSFRVSGLSLGVLVTAASLK